jgi:hypothetical protein
MADIRQKAVATAYDYDQGSIAVLNDDTTRRLVASVVLTESRGGDPELTNRQGFVGSFQHGAQALATADFVDPGKLAIAMAGFKSEWAWANSGGMTQFLENRENWKQGLSLDQFKQSPDLQNEVFKHNAERAYARAVSEGVLKEGDKPEKIAGFLKVEHVMGYGHAKAAANGERVFRGPDGASNYDYMHDITRDRDGLNKPMALAREQSSASLVKAAEPDVMLSSPNHPEFKRFRQTYDALGATTAFDTDAKQINTAAFITMKSMELGMHVDKVIENKVGELFPIQDPGKAYEKIFKVDRAMAEAFPIAESTKQFDELSRKVAVAQENPQQTRTFSV